MWFIARSNEVMRIYLSDMLFASSGVQAIDAFSVTHTAARLNLPTSSTSYSKEVSLSSLELWYLWGIYKERLSKWALALKCALLVIS